ncbi:hypothetical protein EON82_20930, partial [bacterium]
MRQALRAKLERFTRGAPHRQPSEWSSPDALVLIPPMMDLARGFEIARPIADLHGRVRIVGIGATLARQWPDWVADHPGLSFCELGAYSGSSKAEVSAPLRSAIQGWLDRIFEDVLPGTPGHRVFTGTAAVRIFQEYIDASPVVQMLTEAHPDTPVHYADASWLGRGLAEGPQQRKTSFAEVVWKSRLAAATGVAFAGAVARTIRDRARAADSFRALRSQRSTGPSPRRWVALVSDWPRINWHVVETIALPTLEDHESLGVILLLGLSGGQRAEATLKREGTQRWAGLGALQDHGERCQIVQLVMPESRATLFLTLVEAAFCSAKVWAAMAHNCVLHEGALTVDLHDQLWSLAKLASVDVLRVRLVEAAARERMPAASGRAPVVFSANGTAEACTADLLLQRSGAITYHLFHGSSGDDLVGGAEHPSSYHCAWTA